LRAFEHSAIFDEENSRIEMRLVSIKKQRIEVAGEHFDFEAGEYIVTEHSHKYSPEEFESMARKAGFSIEAVWLDSDELFSVQYLVAA